LAAESRGANAVRARGQHLAGRAAGAAYARIALEILAAHFAPVIAGLACSAGQLAGTEVAGGRRADAIEAIGAARRAVIGAAEVALGADLAAQVADVGRQIVVTKYLAIRSLHAEGKTAGLTDLD
jgi:hypothetical protein